MSKAAQEVQKAVDAMKSDATTIAPPGDDMTATATATRTKRTRQSKADKPERAPRAAKGSARLSAETVFVFKTSEGVEKKIPPRGIAFLNALEKLERGTADQVAARVVKSDYNGKQDTKMLSRYFLRKLYNVGAVKVEQPKAE